MTTTRTDAVSAGRAAVWAARQRYERMRGLLDVDRQSHMTHWKDLDAFILPRRGRFNAHDTNKGDRRNQKIIDSTGTFAARTLAAGMSSGVTPQSRPWFRMAVGDYALNEQADVRAWLDEVADRMRKVLGRSNLYKVLPICYGDLGVFGTHAMMCLEDDEKVVRFYAFPIGSYYLANDSKGQVRVFLREFRMTVRQLVDKFGKRSASGAIDWSNFTQMIRTHWDNNTRDTWVDVVHVIEPNDEWDPTKLHAKYKRFRSCYYERGVNANSLQLSDMGETFLEERGFDEFPVFAPRWEVTGEDVYATTCPGMIALGDIKELQHTRKKGSKALDKMVDPPLIGPTALKQANTSLLPGDITYTTELNGKSELRAIHEVNLRLDFVREHVLDLRQLVMKAMFADLFLMLDYQDEQGGSRQPVTATEIQERHEEKLLALGPMLENLNQELLDPLIERVYNIMDRMGLLPEPPEALAGQPFDVEYTSVMAQAQKLIGLGSVERMVGFVGNLSTASENPAVWDKLDTDQMIDEYGEAAGVPSRLIVPDEQVAAIRARRAQAEQQAQAAALATQASVAAKNLSQTEVGGANALTALIGGGSNGAAAA